MNTQLKMSVPPPYNPNLINQDITIQLFQHLLRTQGCNGCDLGLQPNLTAPVVCKGNPNSGRMVIGECPGLQEDLQGIPFIGPAGVKQGEIFASQGWDVLGDWYWTNVCLCRPFAPLGASKQNLTPTLQHRKACFPYLQYQIKYINPKLVLLLGAVATNTLIPETKNKPMRELAGKTFISTKFPDQVFFCMYHPAALLHTQSKRPDEFNKLRIKVWEDVQLLKKLDLELTKFI